jgi:hypothetical protein
MRLSRRPRAGATLRPPPACPAKPERVGGVCGTTQPSQRVSGGLATVAGVAGALA